MARKLVAKIRIEAEDRAAGVVGKVQGRFKKLGSFIKNNLGASFIAGALSIAALTRALRKVIGAANEQEIAVRRLDAALSSLGPSAAIVSKSLQDQASSLQQLTTFGDEQIIRGQALVASFNRSESVIKSATVGALDLSAALGIDLKAAFLLLGRAAAGDTSTLSRYGIILDENIPKTEKFAEAIKKVNDQFGGQAAALAMTNVGKFDQAFNAVGDTFEGVGRIFTQNRFASRLADAIKLIAEIGTSAFPQLEKASTALSRAQDEVAKSTQRVLDREDALKVARGIGLSDFEALIRFTKDDTAKKNALRRADDSLTTAETQLSLAQAQLSKQFEIQASAAERAATATSKFTKATTAADAILKQLGVSTDKELNAALEKNRQEMAALVKGFALGGVSVRAFAEGQNALNKSTAELRAQLNGTKVDADAAVTGFDSLGSSVAQAAGATDVLVRSQQTLRTELAATAQQVAFTSAQFDLLAATQGRSAATAAAVSAGGRLSLGGRRVRLPGGGSRFTSEPGLNILDRFSRTTNFGESRF